MRPGWSSGVTGATSASARTFSGCRRAIASATPAPQLWPATTAGPSSRAAMARALWSKPPAARSLDP